jgi:hypothetical protein
MARTGVAYAVALASWQSWHLPTSPHLLSYFPPSSPYTVPHVTNFNRLCLHPRRRVVITITFWLSRIAERGTLQRLEGNREDGRRYTRQGPANGGRRS